MEEVSIRFLAGESDAGTLRQLYDAVIVPSFLPVEREPIERLRRVLSADELRGAIAVMPDGLPVGALFLEWFADIRAALLCYFAIRPDLRGRGIGRQLVAVAAPQWRAESSHTSSSPRQRTHASVTPARSQGRTAPRARTTTSVQTAAQVRRVVSITAMATHDCGSTPGSVPAACRSLT